MVYICYSKILESVIYSLQKNRQNFMQPKSKPYGVLLVYLVAGVWRYLLRINSVSRFFYCNNLPLELGRNQIIMQKKSPYTIAIMLFVLLSTSCATIFSGTSTKVKVSGVQENAKVFYNGNYEGVSPLKVKVSKKNLKEGAIIDIKKDGYQDASVKLIRKTKASAIIGNILFTGAIGLVIDFATAAIYKPHPEEIKFNLEKTN